MFVSLLTECVHTRQELSEMAKSWILMTLGWVDILMGGVHHTKYFWTSITLSLVGAHPNFEVTRKNQLLCGSKSMILPFRLTFVWCVHILLTSQRVCSTYMFDSNLFQRFFCWAEQVKKTG